MCANCNVLRSENRELKRQMGLEVAREHISGLKRELDLTGREAVIALALYESARSLPVERLRDIAMIESMNGVAVIMWKLRAKLGGPDSISKAQKTGAYAMSAAGRAVMQAALARERIAVNDLMETSSVDIPMAIAVLAGRLAHGAGAVTAIDTLGRISTQLEAHRGHRG